MINSFFLKKNTIVFSAQNRQINKNIPPGQEKHYYYGYNYDDDVDDDDDDGDH